MDSVRTRGSDVSIDDIAEDAGVSKPVLYGHFGDKLGLADAIAAFLADSVIGLSLESVNEDGDDVDFPKAIEAIVRSLVDLVEHEPELYGFLVRTIRVGERGFFDNSLVDVIRIRGGELAGQAEPGIDPAMAAVLVDGTFGFLLFAVESWKTTRGMSREQLVRTLVAAVVAGFSTATGRDHR